MSGGHVSGAKKFLHTSWSYNAPNLARFLGIGVLPVCIGTAVVDNKGSQDANPAIINVGDDVGPWSPGRALPGGRYGSGGRLADVFLQPPNSLGPTSAKLRWDISRLGSQSPRIDGFRVKYRQVLDAERGE